MGHALKTFILALPVVLAAAASCTDNLPEVYLENETANAVYLKIDSVTTSARTRAAIEGTKFPTADEASIGLFLEGTGYTDARYRNIKYTKPAGSDIWTDPQIELLETEATVHGYYPYVSGLTGISGIPISSSVNGNDWMWATPVKGVSSSNPETSLSMNHALALVEITFNIVGYDALTKMTNITLTGESFSSSGTLNAMTGALKPGPACVTDHELSNTVELSQTDGKITVQCLLIPTKTGTDADALQDFKVSITLKEKTLKEKTLSATLSGEKGVIVRQGTKSTVSLNVKGTSIEVAEVGISEWISNGVSGNTATVDGHRVTVLSEDIPVTLSLAGASSLSGDDDVTASESLAISYDKTRFSDGKYGVSITCDKTGACTIRHDSNAGFISVSGISDDITITISKTTN